MLVPVIFTATACWVPLVATSVRGVVIAGGTATVNVAAEDGEAVEATPSAVTTVIEPEPAVARLRAGMVAVQEVVDTAQVFVPVSCAGGIGEPVAGVNAQ